MPRKDNRADPAATLRRQAETCLRESAASSPEEEAEQSPEAVRQTLHELRVHQIELEMQNEELRRAQVELDAERARYFDLYDLAPVGYCTLSEQGLILQANLTAVSLLGMTRAALIKQRLARFILKEDQDRYYGLRKHLLNTGAPQACELRMVNKDGVTFWAHLQATVAPDEGNGPVCRVVISDITERKQAEVALQIHAQQYQDLIQYLHAGVVVHAPDTTIVLANQQATRLLGLSMDQMLGKTATDPTWIFVREDLTPMPVEEYPIYRVLATHQPLHNLILGINSSSGALVWVLVNAFPEWNTLGDLRQVVVTFTDITERKQAEETLRETQALLQAAMDQSPAGIAITDASGGKLRYINLTGELILGGHGMGNDQSVLCWPLLDLDGGPLNTDEHPLKRAIKSGETTSRKFIVQRAVGDDRMVLGNAAPIKDEVGRIVAGILIFTDITEHNRLEGALRESENLYRAVVERSPEPIGIHQNGEIIYINPAGIKLLGAMSVQDLIGKPILDVVHPDFHPLVQLRLERLAADGVGIPICEERYLKLDGTAIDVISQTCSIFYNGQPAVLVLAHDITEQKRTEGQLRLAASVFSHSREGILITNADGTIIEVNEAFTRITGYPRAEVLGRNPRLLSSGLHDPSFFAELWRDLIEKGHWYGEIWNRRKEGEIYVEMLTISAVHNAQGQVAHYVALFSDITVLKEHERQLEHIAHYDALTNLPNRVLLADRLQQAMAQAQRRGQQIAVTLLDLDGFKAINDGHGHETGDHLLMTVAARMKQALREGDTLARLGGDEFVAVLIDLADIEASIPMLARLLAAAAQPVSVADAVLHVSASLGVTFYPQADEVDADQLLRQADQAMYQAKLAGKNRYHVFSAAQDRSLRALHESLDRIHRALTEHEFVLYYQPKVNMRTGVVIGAEALIRWQHPEQGLLPPVVFLPVIENHPLAVEIGEWVIETALTQMEIWQTAGLAIPVSVNIGARQLQQQNFVQRLRTRLAEHPAIPPARLELEVLETSALEDLNHVSQVIAACRQLGVQFALDDFGTGYSSLTYLKRLAVALLKIDQSFVRGMLDDPEDLAILEGVISLATAFHHQVIAEGVETVAHGEMLLQFGCELAQGYGIARPMPAAEFPAWLAAWRPDPRWADRAVVRHDNLPILFAGVQHRAWVMAIEAFLNGTRDALSLDHHVCRFGAWLVAERLVGCGILPALLVIDTLHQQVHELAAELVELHNQGRKPEAWARLGELHALRDRLLEALTGLLQERQT